MLSSLAGDSVLVFLWFLVIKRLAMLAMYFLIFFCIVWSWGNLRADLCLRIALEDSIKKFLFTRAYFLFTGLGQKLLRNWRHQVLRMRRRNLRRTSDLLLLRSGCDRIRFKKSVVSSTVLINYDATRCDRARVLLDHYIEVRLAIYTLLVLQILTHLLLFILLLKSIMCCRAFFAWPWRRSIFNSLNEISVWAMIENLGIYFFNIFVFSYWLSFSIFVFFTDRLDSCSFSLRMWWPGFWR